MTRLLFVAAHTFLFTYCFGNGIQEAQEGQLGLEIISAITATSNLWFICFWLKPHKSRF